MIQIVNVLTVILIVIYSVYCSSVCKERLGLDGCDLLPPDDRCGEVRPAPRVVGGENAKLGQFPWATLLYSSSSSIPKLLLPRIAYRRGRTRVGQLLSKLTKNFECGASVISDRFVISAGHCCQDKEHLKLVSVRVGEHDLQSAEDCEGGRCAPPPQDIPIHSYVIHKGFDINKMVHDICLLRLKWPISFNEFVSPICLPISKHLQNKKYQGEYLEVAGWGTTGFEGLKPILAEVLQTTSLQVVAQSECKNKLGQYAMMTPQLCVGGGGAKDSCAGDSGGPLMGRLPDSSNSSQRYFLVGIVSYGHSRCRGDLPASYVDVSKYIEWIVNNMALMEGSQ